MSAKVYVLLDLIHAGSAKVARILRGKPGVAVIDVLEGPPDIIVIIEAPERQKAAEYLMDILNSVEGVTENLCVLPVRESTRKGGLEETGRRDKKPKRNIKEEVQL